MIHGESALEQADAMTRTDCEDQWERINYLLPGRAGHVGGTAQDNRRFVEAVLYRYRAGIPWRELPERFGDWKNTLTVQPLGEGRCVGTDF
jgi:transposase